MKKYIQIVLAAMLCLSMSVTALAADLGEIGKLSDTVLPDGENGKISTLIAGNTDSNGVLALPLYKNAELLDVTVTKGTLEGELKKTENGGTKYYLAQFAEKEAEVELTLKWNQKDTYKLGKAKTKGSAPGGLKAVAYSMTNSAPIKVDNYILELAVPEGYEMSGIVDYDPEDDYSIYAKNSYKFGHHTFGELKPGEKAKFTVNISKTPGSLPLIMWAITILVSAFFLYKNKDMLKQAKELAEKKKTKTRND